MWSRLETGAGGRVTLATWNRAAAAVGGSFTAYIKSTSAADQPRDAAHLRNQELIIRTASAGGWRALPEAPIDRDARTSRAVDVLLERGPAERSAVGSAVGSAEHSAVGSASAQREYAIIEIWDWFEDVGAAQREFDRRLDAVERYAISRMVGDEATPRTGGCWVVRATQRNRRLLREHIHLFRARFPGSAVAWLAALTSPATPMPAQPAFVWVAVKGSRLYPARVGMMHDSRPAPREGGKT